MCGIAGIFNFDRCPIDQNILAQMSNAMIERGPDDHGIYIADGIGLAHQRLSIIDLTPAGRCPMTNETGTLQLVFNGEEAVRSQLVSDVPLGVFLSGGIDSTAIAALAAEISTTPVRTFSMVFQEAKCDERQWSRIAARQIGTDHIEVEISRADFFRELPTALDSMNQPTVDGLNTYLVSKAAHDPGLTVPLSGTGADELFGGYNGYSKSLILERNYKRLHLFPTFFRQTISKIIGWYDGSEKLRKVSDLMVYSHHPYFISRRLFSNSQIRLLLVPDISITSSWENEAFGVMETASQGYGCISRISALELQTYLRSTLLRDTDQMSMAHALEVRVPLIDVSLVERCFALPDTCKVIPNEHKPLLTLPLSNMIPRDCVNRRKMVFEIPIQPWLKQRMGQDTQKVFCGFSIGRYWPFNARDLEKLVDQFKIGQISWSRIWAVFVLLQWLERNGVED